MTRDTRTQFLDQAEALFAERGFYGVSIAAVAKELGLTKQALLHHFGSKEKLYAAVLQRISDQFERIEHAVRSDRVSPRDQLKAYFLQLLETPEDQSARTRLLMRELLDNKTRAATAGTWFLKPFLDGLVDRLLAISNWADASRIEALVFIYQILGAINYFQISQPTLTGIFGRDACAELDANFPAQLSRLIEAGLAARG